MSEPFFKLIPIYHFVLFILDYTLLFNCICCNWIIRPTFIPRFWHVWLHLARAWTVTISSTLMLSYGQYPHIKIYLQPLLLLFRNDLMYLILNSKSSLMDFTPLREHMQINDDALPFSSFLLLVNRVEHILLKLSY